MPVTVCQSQSRTDDYFLDQRLLPKDDTLWLSDSSNTNSTVS